MSKNTGGSVFPLSNDNYRTGITLRDYFAAKSMAAHLQCEFPSVIPEKANGMSVAEFVAYQAYAMADAMLEAREK